MPELHSLSRLFTRCIAAGIVLLAWTVSPASASATEPSGEGPTASSGWLGVMLDTDFEGEGARVRRTFPSSPAEVAGVRTDDVITHVAGTEIPNARALIDAVGTLAAGTRVTLALNRGGEPTSTTEVDVILGIRPDDPSAISERMIGDPAPNMQVRDVRTGVNRALLPDDNKVRIIEFWATWCGACRNAAPELEAAVSELDPTRFELVAVSGEEYDLVRSNASTHGERTSVLQSEDEEANAEYWVSALPTYFLVDSDGIVQGVGTGGFGWARLVAQARTLLAESAPEDAIPSATTESETPEPQGN